MRNLFEQAIARQANRLAAMENVTREQLMEIRAEDLEDAEDGEKEGLPAEASATEEQAAQEKSEA